MEPCLFSLTCHKVRHDKGHVYLNSHDELDIDTEYLGYFSGFHKAVTAMKQNIFSSYDDHSIPLGYLIEGLGIDSDTIQYSPISFASFDSKGDLLEMFTFDETLPEPNCYNRRKKGDMAFKIGDILIDINSHIYCMVTELPKSSDDSPIRDIDNQYGICYLNGETDEEMPVWLFYPTIVLDDSVLMRFEKQRKTIMKDKTS